MPSFLEAVSNAAAGRDEKKKKKKDDGQGLNFQQRLQSMFSGDSKKKKKGN